MKLPCLNFSKYRASSMAIFIGFIWICLFQQQVSPTETRESQYSLYKSDEALVEMTPYPGVKSSVECASYCSRDNKCFCFVYGAGTCGLSSLWPSGGEPYTPVYQPGFNIYSLDECVDVPVPQCASLTVENGDYAQCTGTYHLAPLKYYQRPVFVMAEGTAQARYLRYMNMGNYWCLSRKVEMTKGCFVVSQLTRACHPLELSPWHGHFPVPQVVVNITCN